MARPTERPSKPYTLKEVLDKVEQHFIKEGNPQCRDSITDTCLYGRTGCAVGCLMVLEDAQKVDGPTSEGGTDISNVSEWFSDIYNIYFTEDLLPALIQLQLTHDNGFADLQTCIDRLRTENGIQ